MKTQIITSPDYYRIMKIFTTIATNYKVLNKSEERAMIEKYLDNPDKLKQLLIKHNIQIVLNQARKYIHRVANPADLLADGYYGLTVAAERFDINRNIKFNTYATPWVFKYIISVFYSRSPVVGTNAFSLNASINASTDNEIEMLLSADNMIDEKYSHASAADTEMTQFSIKEVIADVVKKLEPMSPFRNAIIQRNLFNGESLAKISAEYKVKYTAAVAEKLNITTTMKNLLRTEYNINELSDII